VPACSAADSYEAKASDTDTFEAKARISQIATDPYRWCIDPDKRWMAAEATLRASFGFTEAEARLAARISGGSALDTVAKSLGISKETGRNQLKNIFAKAGVRRQAELVAVVSSTANAREEH
jgi:DNA-binding CsgD family transcriptional regulator